MLNRNGTSSRRWEHVLEAIASTPEGKSLYDTEMGKIHVISKPSLPTQIVAGVMTCLSQMTQNFVAIMKNIKYFLFHW